MRKILLILTVLFLSCPQAQAENMTNNVTKNRMQFDGFFVNTYQVGGLVNVDVFVDDPNRIILKGLKRATRYVDGKNIVYAVAQIAYKTPQQFKPGSPPEPAAVTVRRFRTDTYLESQIILQIVNQDNGILYEDAIWNSDDGLINNQLGYPNQPYTSRRQVAPYPVITK